MSENKFVNINDSDMDLKEEIVDISYGLSKISNGDDMEIGKAKSSSSRPENKCGYIMFSTPKNEFYLNCIFCNTECMSLDIFSKHFLDHHFQEWNTSSQEGSINTTIKFEKVYNFEAVYDDADADADAYSESGSIVNDNENNSDKDSLTMNDEIDESQKYLKENSKKQAKYLSKKVKQKSKLEDLKCDLCDLEFPNKSTFNRHRVSHIERSKRPFKCDECSKCFNTAKNLRRHQNIHFEQRIHECDYCYSKFTSIDSRREHEKDHSNEFKDLVKSIGKKSAISQQMQNEGLEESEIAENLINDSVPDGYWRCDICHKMFKNSYKQENHKQYHADIKPFSCQECGKEMITQKHLDFHMLIHKQDRRFKCLNCPASFYASSHLRRHEQKSCNPDKPYEFKVHIKLSKLELQCEICGRQCENRSSLIRHMASHTDRNQRPFKCEECMKGFNSARHLQRHQKIHFEKRIHECDFCYSKFDTSELKKQHEKSHNNEFKELVSNVGKKMAVFQQIQNENPESIQDIKQIDDSVPEGYWRCDVCDKMFKNSYKQEDHKRYHDEIKPFMCEQCGKGMASKRLLNHHILVHNEDRRYKCSKCGASFFSSAHLKRHEKTACNSEKPFQCEICQFKFTRKEHLSAHHLTHEKNRTKNFKCEYCEATYLTSNALRVHKKKHAIAMEGPYKCTFCQAIFQNKEALKRHEKRHENKGAFKCEHCEKRFNDKDDMKQHEKRQHFNDIKPHECQLCKEKFFRKSELKEHFTSHSDLNKDI